ncbi:MAG: M23 family metallopeptidase [Acidobacteria bacterium]|nr:M23 family metallopeptidase [Acidobacteriota bacterium]
MKRRWVQTVVGGALLLAPLVAGEAAPARACAEGIEVRFTPEKAAQGSVVLVEVCAAAPLENLRGQWSGETVHFWSDGEPRSPQRALLGVDLNRLPGKALLKVTAERDGKPVECSVTIPVEKTEFAVERLRVDKRFVELSPEDAERARREAERLQEILARVTPERLWSGGFQSPAGDVKPSGNFGKKRILNEQPRSPHAGEDFPAPAGAPVLAAQRGRVALADDLFFSGQTVMLDHGLGLFTYYAHLEKIEVKEGDMVEAGAVLGRVGATGRATGAHLHWAARLNQARVNPLDLLAVPAE